MKGHSNVGRLLQRHGAQGGGFRLAHLSDLHVCAEPSARVMGVLPLHQLERTAGAVARFDPDLVLVTGDIAHDGSRDAYRAARAALSGLRCPVYVVPGNHDDPAELARGFGPQPLVVSAGGWRIVLLDSRRGGSESGVLRRAQLARADQLLARMPAGPVAVAIHHPPVEVGSPWLDAKGLAGAACLEQWVRGRGDVHVVLAGHVHQLVRRRFGSAVLLTAPSTCAQFAPGTRRCEIADRRPAWRSLLLERNGGSRTGVRRLAPAA